MKKRILSILIILCLVAPMIPAITLPNLTAEAATTTDAFGINIDETMTTAETAEALANNPYGTEGWVSLFTVSELSAFYGSSGNTRYWYTYNYNEDYQNDTFDEGSIETPTSGTQTGMSESNSGYSIMDTAACDVASEGQKRYTAVLAYDRDDDKLWLFLKDSAGNTVSNAISVRTTTEDSLGWLSDTSPYYNNAFVSIAAGDFDGDGQDSLIVYIAEMEKAAPSIYEYYIEYNGTQGNILLYQSQKKVVIDNVYDLLGVDDLSRKRTDNGKVSCNAPTVQLVAADTDNDNVDELIITAGLNKTEDSVSSRASKMYIYDYLTGSSTWHQSCYLNTTGYQDEDGKNRLRYASSAVGNIIYDSTNTDYPEIVTAGWVGTDDKTTDDIGSYVTGCESVKTISETSVGTYWSTPMGTLTTSNDGVSDYTADNHYCSPKRDNLVQVSVALLDGTATSAYVLIADTVFQYNTSTWMKSYRYEIWNPAADDEKWDSSYYKNAAVIDVVSGNFDGNLDGREQFVFATMKRAEGQNQYWYQLYVYGKDATGEYYEGHSSNIISKKKNTYLSLCAPDVDNDGVIARVQSVTKTYTAPEILTILEAAPFYEELDGGDGDFGNSATTYGTTNAVENSTGSGSTLSAGIIVGFEYTNDLLTGLATGAGFEEKVSTSYTSETTESTTIAYTLEYSNDTGENTVVVYRRPVTSWVYELKNTGGTLVLSREGTLVTSMLTVDDYNEIAPSYGLSQIADDLLATPGDPFSYRSNSGGLTNGVTSQTITTYSNGGTTTQTISNATSTEKSFTYEVASSFSVYGIIYGVKVGTEYEYNTRNISSTINTNEITKSGTVSGNAQDGYDFKWQFVHWTVNIDDRDVPVLGYILTDVEGPPAPPENLRAEDITSTSATLAWDESNRAGDVYYIYQIYSDGSYVQIGEADISETSYALTGLSPNTSYTYAISSYSETEPYTGESVMSSEVIVTTLPEDEASVEIESPSDLSVQVGGDATFSGSITVFSDSYNAVNYQWQSRTNGGSWSDVDGATSSKLTLTSVEKSDNGTEYRLVFKVSYKNLNAAVCYYSDAATLSVGLIDVDTTLSIEKYESGSGTLADPYEGIATSSVQTGTTETTETSTQNVVIPATDTVPKLTVYSIGSGDDVTYYGVGTVYDEKTDDDETVYYHVTNDNGTYTAGTQITVTEATVYTDSDSNSTVTLPDGVTVSQNTLTLNNVTYTLMAAVTGTEKTPLVNDEDETRLATFTGIATCYWVSGETAYTYTSASGIGEADSTVDVSELYDVYCNDSNYILLGREESWVVDEGTADSHDYNTKTDYLYTLITVTTAESSTTYSVTSVMSAETSVSYSETDFDPADLTVVTAEVTETVTTPVYATQDGTTLTLKATVKTASGGDAAEGATVDFQIINRNTGGTTTVAATTNASGVATATWTATASGLYSIQAVVRADATYASASSGKQYYRADKAYGIETTETTEYQIVLTSEDGELSDGAITYGDAVSVRLQSRTVTVTTTTDDDGTTTTSTERGSWSDVSSTVKYVSSPSDGSENVTITASTTGTEAYMPTAAGSYTVSAYLVDGTGEEAVETLAATTNLQVSQRSVTITPNWTGEVPASAAAVTPDPEPELASADSNLDLTTVFEASSSYFNLDSTTASGTFTVSLSYLTSEDAATMVSAFKKNYFVTLATSSFSIRKNSATVYFSADENGAITGQYTDKKFTMASGSRKTAGTSLYFIAKPDSGYAVSGWTINGTFYDIDDELPDGFSLASSGKQLVVESFDVNKHVVDGALTVSVQFKSSSNKITYSADSHGSVSAKSGTGDTVASGASVANGTSVFFTAEPEDGYIVDYWVVNGSTYLWDGTEETYRGTTLTLEDIQEAKTVIVYFKESTATFTVATEVVNESETRDDSLATITVTDAETGDTVDLTEDVAENTSLTFTAAITNATNNMVKSWQVSTDDGATWTTLSGSGGQTSVTVYNISADTRVRVIVTVAQTYGLSYSIQCGEDTVTDTDIAALTATSNGQMLTSGTDVSAYVPVDFTLTLSNDYYLIGWEGAEADTEDPLTAHIESLTGDTVVTVTIGKKPVITIEDTKNGTITVTDSDDQTITSGTPVAPGTTLTVTLTPDDGYEVDSADDSAAYADGTGSTTDVKTYTIEVQDDQTISATFKELAEYVVTYSTVITTGDSANGELTAAASRKGLDAYAVSSLESGETVYDGSTVTLTATPEEGYRVKEWVINGSVYKESELTYIGTTLTLDGISKDTTVTVQFVSTGSRITVESGSNGSLVSAMVGDTDVFANITSGFYLSKDASVTVTAKADTGYEPEAWKVNGETKQEGGESFTYTATEDGVGAVISVTFIQQKYAVSWSGTGSTGGTVAATGYDGSSADIRGGTDVTFTASPADGAVISHWTVNGETVTDDEGNTISTETLTWTVPNGAIADPAVDAYNVVAVFKNAPYEITFDQPANGTLTAVDANGKALATTETAENGSDVTFTVTPASGYLVESYTVNGTTTESHDTTFAVTVTGPMTVSVTIVPDSYTVTYNAEGKGTVNGNASGSVTVAYDGTTTFTAKPDEYNKVSGWKVGGVTTTTGVSDDGQSLTLSGVRADTEVTAVFTSSVGYGLAYSVVTDETSGETGGTLSATADGVAITLTDSQETIVAGGSSLVFTANPNYDMMVDYWTVNGEKVEGNITTSLTIDYLEENVEVAVKYTKLVVYEIPQSGTGYTVSDVVRDPADAGTATQIRQNGTVSFTVTLANDFTVFEKLIISGWDCLNNKAVDETTGCDSVTVEKKTNDDGSISYKITVANVTDDLHAQIVAHKLKHVAAKEATCIEDGYIEHWYCEDEDCKKYFTDETAQTALDYETEVLIKKETAAHDYEATFIWNGTTSVTAELVCKLNNHHTVTLSSDKGEITISKATDGDVTTFTATAEYTDRGVTCTYTGTKKMTYHAAKDPDCTNTGNIAYWTDEDGNYFSAISAADETKLTAEQITIDVVADAHSYSEPVFTWNGTDSATATFTCSICGDKQTVDAAVTSSTSGNTITFTATATYPYSTEAATSTRKLTKVAAKAATCAAAGNIEYWVEEGTETYYTYTDSKTMEKIEDKDSVTLARKTAESDHSWGSPAWTWSGTTATVKLTCSVCKETK
ncbi:MAG: fibronectin type III domain-containing protein, partial [Lachnospiraceae bacterium]|nr:fibronectin type III domain-containing protein [Lachnospiraceae bacterium]